MKNWEKPQLIVLVRGEPGEAIRNGCKTGETGAGPEASDTLCLTQGGGSALGGGGGPCVTVPTRV